MVFKPGEVAKAEKGFAWELLMLSGGAVAADPVPHGAPLLLAAHTAGTGL